MAHSKTFRLPILINVGVSCGCIGYLCGNTNIFGRDRYFSAAKAATPPATSPFTLPVPEVPHSKNSILPTESRASQIMRFGYPGFDNLRTFEDFVLSYDRRNRIPHWVYEHLTPDRMTYHPSVDRSKCTFKEDTSIHGYFQSKNSDYKGSSYDRGHIAAAGNHRRSQNSIDQTFLLSNMAPQDDPKVILVEIGPENYELESFVLPNSPISDDDELKQLRVPLESIERAAGFLIFDKLSQKNLKRINGKAV